MAIIARGQAFGRIYFDRYPDPLGYGKTPSRFSDPRNRVPNNRFGVLYLGETLKVCFLEAVLRDLRNGVVGDYPIDEDELRCRIHAVIEVVTPLHLVDLRSDGLVRMGVPTDVARGSKQTLARKWSVAFHDHPSTPDGIIYPSRLNGHTNIAIYDRAVPKLHAVSVLPLLRAPRIGNVMTDLLVAVA